MALRVPINPQTNVAQGQLGYEKAVDVTAGQRALAAVVDKYAQVTAQDQKKQELFDVQRRIIDETNNIQQDFEAKKKVQPLGAPNFTQQVNGEYNTRHIQMVQELKDQGYDDGIVNEYATRLGTIRSQYVAQAIDFQEKSHKALTAVNFNNSANSLSQYASSIDGGEVSALDELRVLARNSDEDAPTQEAFYEQGKAIILKGAREGFTQRHPDLVLRVLDPQHVTSSTANAPDGSTTVIPTQPVKPNGQLANNIVAGLKNRGLSDAQARGVAAGISSESANVTTARNTGGGGNGAFGLGQWRGARQAALFKQYGKNPTGSQQLDFLVAELNGGDVGGKVVLSQADEVGVLHSYIHDFMRPSEAGAKGDIKRGLAALGRKVSAHADATVANLSKGQIAPGNIDVTQLPVVSNPDGSVSTVRSISIEQDGKAYLIPTVVNGQVVSNQEAIAAFQQTGKNLGTFKDSKSADAYAQQLHESEARRVNAVGVGADGKTGIGVLDLASGPERMEMLQRARIILNQQNADTKAANKEAHDNWYNGFLNQLQDGTIGQVELNTAYTSGQLTDFDERKKAQAIIDDKNKKDDDLTRFHLMLASGQKFNPYDNDAQKAADAGYESAVKYSAKNDNFANPFAIALRTWQRTGILPKQGAVMIRGGLVSTDPQQVAGAASVANNMIKENPNAFAGVDGRVEIEHAAVAYGHYIYDLGMSPQDASMKVAQENDPKFKAKFQYNDPATTEILKTLRQTGVNATQSFKGAKFPNQDALNEGNQTYYELLRDQLNRGLDFGAATAQVDAQMQKVYGVNSNGHVVKYPPEKAYPPINGRWDYIYHDAQKTVKDETGRDPISVNLTPIPGVTDEDFRRGRLARYRIIYSYKNNGQTIVDSVPGEFAADINSANQIATEKNRKEFVKARKAEVDRGAPVTFPGIGEVR